MYIEDRMAKLELVEQQYPLAACETVYIPPGIRHFPHGKNISFSYIAWEGDELGKEVITAPDRNGRLRLMIKWLAEEIDSSYFDKQNYLDTLTQFLIIEFIKQVKYTVHPVVERVRSYMLSHLKENLGLDELAKQAHLSKSHFIRQYQIWTGRTPMRDLQWLRIERARALICTTDQPMKLIASEVGLHDEYQLSKVFKKRLGTCPSQFRNQTRIR
jgi:AraC-like DNA-binding protein